MISRAKNGHFVKGKQHGNSKHPQTPEGWIDRLEVESFVGDGKKGFVNTYTSKGFRLIVWEASDQIKKINKKANTKIQADPVRHVKQLVQKRNSHWRNQEADNRRSNIRYYANPGLYAENYRFYYYCNGGKQKIAEYNRTHTDPWDSSIERAKKLARIRDAGICQWFGCSYKADHVHHIYGAKRYPQWADQLWNLICLCRNHHAQFHEEMGEANVAAFIRSGRMRYYDVPMGHFLYFHNIMGQIYGH